MEKRGDALVPGAGRLLQSIQGPREQAHVIRVGGVDEADGLLAVDLLGEMTVEEGVGDVHLVHRPGARSSKVQDGTDRARFDNRSKRIREVDAASLTKTSNHPARLVALE